MMTHHFKDFLKNEFGLINFAKCTKNYKKNLNDCNIRQKILQNVGQVSFSLLFFFATHPDTFVNLT